MRKLKAFFIFLLTFLSVIASQVLSAGAVEVNSKPAKTGDIITYEIHAVNCTKKVIAVDLNITYDSAALKCLTDEIQFPSFNGIIANTDLDGEIRLNTIDLSGYDFQADSILVYAKFEVISDYNPYPMLKYEVTDFIDADMANHQGDYVYDLTYVNVDYDSYLSSAEESDTVSSGETSSVVSKSSDSENKSKTEESSLVGSGSDSDLKSSVSTTTSVTDSDISSKLKSQSPDIPSSQASASVETNDESGSPGKISMIPMIIGVCALAIILVVAFIVVKSKSTGNHMD